MLNKKTFSIAFIIIVFLISWFVLKSDSVDEVQAFSVVQEVNKGSVSSGIETTGKIEAVQKLDLDVYKQFSRIDIVNIQNGNHVDEGDTLISFDKSDANVDTKSSAVSVKQAELDLENALDNSKDPNTQISTLKNQIKAYEKSFNEAYLDFLNTNVEIKSKNNSTENKMRPVISGRYVKGANEYKILIDIPDYNDRNRTESLLVYKVFDNSGKISEHELIYDITTPIADTGLDITFTSSMNPEEGDSWKILIPNTENYSYSEAESDYEEIVRELNVNLENSKQDLENLQHTDSTEYRDLTVEQAELALLEAKQRLSENYDSVEERDILAPFAGTVQDMENVVVGATPTGGTEDSINLGTLVSDEYLVTFTLDATDVAKIYVGQKVEVAVTSYSNQPEFDAEITEISSLPASSGVAQYDVSAKLNYDAKTAETILREGMLANIVIIQEEKENVLRIPSSSIVYEDGNPTVQVVDSLSEEQQKEFDKLGIVRTNGVELATYPVILELGIEGRFYIEVLNGINEGALILTTSTTVAIEDESSVAQGFGGGAPRAEGSGARNNN